MSWAIVAGAGITAAGAALGRRGQQQTTEQTRELPPWLTQYISGPDGNGGILADVASRYRQQMQNGGLNPLQAAGIEARRQFLTSPEYTQGYGQMRDRGMGLMSQAVAGNPFTTGAARLPSMGRSPMGGMGGGAPGASGLPALPRPSSGGFQYTMNPALSGALTGVPAANTTPMPPPQASMPSVDEIIAEFTRRQQQQAVQDFGFQGGPGNGSE